MRQFFKFMFASMLGFFLTSVIVIFLFMMILVSAASFADKEVVQVKENSILELTFDKPIVDRTKKQPFEEFGFAFGEEKELGLNGIIENIAKAKNDDNIKGIYMNTSILPSRLATIEEIRNALLDFKESGKFIVSYSEVYTQSAYYLASVSDKIYLNPEGFLDFRGFVGQVMFIKGTLEKLDIEMQVIRHGEFKSAIEPLILDKMSEANKEQTLTYLTSMWEHMLKQISKTRNISVQELKEIADSIKVNMPEKSVEYKLIDKLLYKDELIAELKDRTEIKEKDKLNFIKIGKYANAPASLDRKRTKNKIAVIYAVGDIVSGEGDDETIGSERISKAIRDARQDSSIKAIVLRVNSPGGSGLASDVILREMVLAKEVKPIVVSMGDYAASGGYYISCAANKIYAQENTITGSIGVFGVLPNMQGFFNNKLGITFDDVKTSKHADYGSVTRGLDSYEEGLITMMVERFYQSFIGHVAKGRNMTVEQVDAIGSGRVWSGIDAKKIGLVDEFGGLNDAIKSAAELAKLENYKVVNLPKQVDPFVQMIKAIKGNTQTKLIKNELGENYIYFEYLKSISQMDGIQARLPYNIEIR
ncbi:MAG: signal peptide peptidase SppA [Saprospiraceae bacterium]|nr:signal peptide peptidase SppA [Saprospiraceae bacterium]